MAATWAYLIALTIALALIAAHEPPTPPYTPAATSETAPR